MRKMRFCGGREVANFSRAINTWVNNASLPRSLWPRGLAALLSRGVPPWPWLPRIGQGLAPRWAETEPGAGPGVAMVTRSNTKVDSGQRGRDHGIKSRTELPEASQDKARSWNQSPYTSCWAPVTELGAFIVGPFCRRDKTRPALVRCFSRTKPLKGDNMRCQRLSAVNRTGFISWIISQLDPNPCSLICLPEDGIHMLPLPRLISTGLCAAE